ncbi:hypothetical protein [Pseudomonas putida]
MLDQDKADGLVTLARLQALSYPRLRNYRSFFRALDNAQVLGVYEWNEHLSGALFRTISLIEVVMRNRFHHAMSQRYGVLGGLGSKDWYAHVDLNPLSISKVLKVTHYRRGRQMLPRVPVPSPDDVISKLTFGFWPHLLDLEADLHGQPIDWGAVLVEVLPGHRQRQATYWAKPKHRDALFARLDLCNELRNRIAHHEPVWKLGPLLAEARSRRGSRVTVEAGAPLNPLEALDRLRLIYERLVELLRWLCPDSARLYQMTELHVKCLSLLRPESVRSFQYSRLGGVIELGSGMDRRALRKAFKYAARRKQPVIIRDGHRLIGHLTCLGS